jgi:protein-tyrosine-phosphatase
VFELNPGELAILAEACSTRDLIVAMERAWIADGRPMTTHGSRNQLVAHPLLSEIRAHRGVYRQLLVSLKLPDPEDNDAEDSASVIILSSGKQRMTASEAGKKGAAKRWSHVR